MGTIKEALTFDDVLMLPRYSNILPVNTNINLNLAKNINLKVPKNNFRNTIFFFFNNVKLI